MLSVLAVAIALAVVIVTAALMRSALDRGDFSEIDETDLDVFLQRLTTSAKRPR